MKISHLAIIVIIFFIPVLNTETHFASAQTVSTVTPGFLPDYFCQESFGRHASFAIVNSTGFLGIHYLYYAHTLVDDYILEPGHAATLVYEEHNGLPLDLEEEFQFFHDNERQSHPGTDIQTTMINSTADSAYSKVTISADPTAAVGAYWLIFPPGVCTGGSVILLTIGNSPAIVPPAGPIKANIEDHETDKVVVIHSSPYTLASLVFLDPSGSIEKAYDVMVDPDGTSARWFTPTQNGTYTAMITSAAGNVTLPFTVSGVHEQQKTMPHIPQQPPVGNRRIETELKLYSNPEMPKNQRDLWVRFFDANTNTTIQHVSFLLTITKGNHTMFRELLHTHTGVLTLNITSTNDTKWQVYGDHEPILNGWVPHEPYEPMTVRAPVFNDMNSTYHLNIQLFSTDYDNNIFDTTDTPNNLFTFNFYLNAMDQNRTITSSSLPLANDGGIQIATNISPVIGYLRIGQPAFIQTPVSDFSPSPQNFTYITEVIDSKGSVESIQWNNLHLDSMQGATLSNRWTPSRAGNYTVEAFVWGNFTSYPVPLANSLKTSLEVRG